MNGQEFLRRYKAAVRVEAEGLLSQSMPPLTEELFFQFERTGNRLGYESVYFARRKFLTVLGLRAILEKEELGAPSQAVLQKLEAVMEDVCAEECWALPAHVDRRQGNWRITVDLFACETGQTLSELSDRLRSSLSTYICRRVCENVERRVLLPFLASEGGFAWEGAGHNWNAVCCGSIGSICIHLMDDLGDLPRPCLSRVCASLPHYLMGFSGDGACLEGLGYYFYGMSYFVNFAQELRELTGGSEDLWACAGERAGEIAAFWGKCYFPDGSTVNFSDGSDRTPFYAGLALALKRRFPQTQLPDFDLAAGLWDDECWRFVFRKMDLLETRSYLARSGEPKTGGSAPFVHILPEAQWCVAASRGGVGFACKGGSNDEPHNHNDVGSFLYEAAGDTLLAELGTGEYTARYFGPERYDILCNGSQGHNVPLINGLPQTAGGEYRCRNFEAVSEGEICRVSMDLAGTYGCEALRSLRRRLTFSLTDGELAVEDVADGAAMTENLVTYIRPVLTPECVLLRGEKVSAQIRIDHVVPTRDVSVVEIPHSDHAGNPMTVYALRWESQNAARFTVAQISDFNS